MSCEKYQNLISESIDGNISSESSQDLASHLSVCVDCAKVNEDFLAIANFYDEGFMEDSIPPNSQAMWCRINNIIETEVKAELLEEEAKAEPTPGVVKRAWHSSWKFSPAQMITSALGIALVSSLLTIVGIRNFTDPNHGLSEAELKPNSSNLLLTSSDSKKNKIINPKDSLEMGAVELRSTSIVTSCTESS